MVDSEQSAIAVTAALPRVAVIIISWNRIDELVTCLESFSCVTYPNYEVVIVDNASEDASVPTVRERFSWATVIANPENIGYVGGSNVGFRYALAHGADYVFLLNQDTKMTPAVLNELVDVMQRDRRIAITGAKNLLMQNPAYTWGKYGVLDWGPMLVRSVGGYEPDRPEPSPKDVDWVIGNGCMMSRAALERVGLFDEEFFHLEEDVDWSTRARKLGYRVVYVDSAAILHKGSSSGDDTQPIVFFYAYFLGRNVIVFARKHANPLQWAKLLTFMTLGFVLRLLWYCVRGVLTALAFQRPFVVGVLDGFSGRLRRDHITTRRGGVAQTLTKSPLRRFLKWVGA
jgi:GT2 family glycosyltransferase